ncbi:MAG TPA: PIG-L family deacetylase, partial [Kofleriaceae bacterium]
MPRQDGIHDAVRLVMRALVVLALCAGCTGCGDNQHGDGVALAQAKHVAVIAHQDDDLIFMQPDLPEAIERGEGLTNVYVTAGNDVHGTGFSNPRYAGLMAAYGAVAGDQAWECGWITISNHVAQHCRLASANVSLVFLAYPDGGINGENPGSLLSLWQGTTLRATTIADRTTTYNRDELIETVQTILETVHPEVVHTLDLPATHGRDHSDHFSVGALAGIAVARLPYMPTLISYRGYDNTRDAPNKAGAFLDRTEHLLAYYEACAYGCGTCGEPCDHVDHSHLDWASRRYAFGYRN